MPTHILELETRARTEFVPLSARIAKEAVQKAKQVMEGVKIFQVPCRNLAEEGGVLNCVSWTIKMERA